MGYALGAAIGIAGSLRAAPQEPRTNPVAGQPEAIAEGKALFRGECLYCHGRGGAVDGRQHVAVAAGGALFSFALAVAGAAGQDSGRRPTTSPSP